MKESWSQWKTMDELGRGGVFRNCAWDRLTFGAGYHYVESLIVFDMKSSE